MEKSVQNIVLLTDVLKCGIPLHINSLNDAQGKVIFFFILLCFNLVKCNLTKLTTTSLAVKRFTSVAVKQFTSIAVKRFTSLAAEWPMSLAVHKLSGLAVHKLSGQAAHERSGHPAVNPISAGSHGLW